MPPFFSSIRRTTKALIFTGILWLLSCWTWAIHHMMATSPPVTPLLNPLSKNHLSLRTEPRTEGKNLTSAEGIHGSLRMMQHQSSIEPIPVLTQINTINGPPPITSIIFPLHATSGTHHAYLYIGSPPQRQTLIVDTGSRLTAFPCQPHCSNCGTHASPRFDINQSKSLTVVPCNECLLTRKDFELENYFQGKGVGGNSGDGDVNVDLIPSGLRGATANRRRRVSPTSCSKNHCEINQRYTEGSSWTAFEVKDNVWLGSNNAAESSVQHSKHSRPFVFGCQVSEEGLFTSQYADGIMGLSMYTQTLVGSWYAQGSIPHESFSLCFNSKGGHISLGGVASSHNEQGESRSVARHLTPMKFIPFARDNTWYFTATVTSISVGDHILPSDILQYLNDHKGTIIDSGTTDTFLSHKVGQAFSIAWGKVVGRPYSNKHQKYTYEQFTKLPVITIEFEGGTQWDVRPEAYMEAATDSAHHNHTSVQSNEVDTPWIGKRGFTSRIYLDEPHGAVLGANMMMDHDLYFDIANRRLGVARAECLF